MNPHSCGLPIDINAYLFLDFMAGLALLFCVKVWCSLCPSGQYEVRREADLPFLDNACRGYVESFMTGGKIDV